MFPPKGSKTVSMDVTTARTAGIAVAALATKFELLEQKQNKMEMIFNRNPTRHLMGRNSIIPTHSETFSLALQTSDSQNKHNFEIITEKCMLLQ
jgi:hypothetical protein